MTDRPPDETLTPPAAEALVEFARACRAALHAVSLYPFEHPAIGSAISRMTAVSARHTEVGPFRLAVLPDNLLVDGRRLPRPDVAVSEMAALLHRHVIGQLTVAPGMDDDGWRQFLALISRPSEAIREEGGVARAWTTAGGQHLEIREIDYAEVLRERPEGERASWDAVIDYCLASDGLDLDSRALAALKAIFSDPARLSELGRRLEDRIAPGQDGKPASILLEILGAIVASTDNDGDGGLEPIYQNVATLAAGFPPEGMLAWLEAAAGEDGRGVPGAAEVIARLGDGHVAEFVATSVIVSRGATRRLAEAFQALAPDPGRRSRLLGLAEQKVAASAFGRDAGFERLWHQALNLLGGYSDTKYVSQDYVQEIDGASVRAAEAEAERAGEDPPGWLAACLGTVSDRSVRELDLQLMLDLLAIERDAARWEDLAQVAGRQINDLAMVGDLEAAARLLEGLTGTAASREEPALAQATAATIDRLLESSIVQHVVYHLATIPDDEVGHARRLAAGLGASAIRPLAEALAAEERALVRLRLTEIVVAFGPLGAASVEQLKHSANPSVRRTAVLLLRRFGGDSALPDLQALLNDAEAQVQREAVRALLVIGTSDAHEVLQRALTSGTDRSKDAILRYLQGTEDAQLGPLFCYVLRHTSPGGSLQPVYLKALAVLGQVGGSEAIDALGEALHRGNWWAPRRNRLLRGAAARALRRTGDERAVAILREAARSGSFGTRAAARGALEEGRGPETGRE